MAGKSNLISLAVEGMVEEPKSEIKGMAWKYNIEILGDRSKGSIKVQHEGLTISSGSGVLALIKRDATTGQRILSNRAGQAISHVDDPTRSALEYELPDWEGVSSTGITLTTALTKAHDGGAQVASNVPTPGAPNQYKQERSLRVVWQ